MPTKKTPKLADLTIEELQQRQAELTAQRTAILAEARDVQAELDERARALEERRVLEAQRLGQTTRPQQLL